MAASESSKTKIQQMYVAYYGRPGDPAGIEYWGSVLDVAEASGGSIDSIISAFGDSDEYTTGIGTGSTSEQVTTLYQQMFNRDPEADGLAFWVNEVDSGARTLGEVALAIAESAQNDDATTLANKVVAANYYTEQVTATGATYDSADIAAAKAIIGDVTSDAVTVVNSYSATDAALASQGGTTDGASFTLTSSIDTVTGTGGDDTIIGDNATTSAADQVIGGDGNDLIKLFATNTVPQLTSVESMYFNAPGGNVNVSTQSGVTDVELDSAATGRTVTVTSGQDVTLDSITAGGTTTIAGNTPTSLNLTLDGTGVATSTNTLALTGSGLTTLNVTGANNASYIGSLTNTGAKLATINIMGDQTIAITHALTTVKTIDGSSSTGNTLINGVGASSLTFTGGTGNDKITMGATLTSADTLNGGDGTDTLSVSAAYTTATTTNVSNFETIQLAGASLTQNLALLNSNNTLTGLIMSGGTTATVTGINDATATNMTMTADHTAVSLTASSHVAGGTSDAATLTLNDSATNGTGVDITTSLTMANVDDLTISNVSDGSPATSEANSIASLVATDMDKLTITGDQSVSITTAASTLALTEVDASGLTVESGGTFTFNSSAGVGISSILVRGTSGNDTIDISANGTAGTIYTGGGTDALTIDTGQATSLQFTTDTLGSGDLKAGTVITVATAVAAGDIVLNMSTGVEAALNFGGVNLGGSAANVTVNAGISATNNIGYTESGGNSVIQIDLNGDGAYNASDDVQITITGGAAGLAGLQYTAASDTFVTV